MAKAIIGLDFLAGLGSRSWSEPGFFWLLGSRSRLKKKQEPELHGKKSQEPKPLKN